VSASWSVPATATSGLYFARPARDDTGGATVIYFVVRADESTSDLLFQTSDSTWEAYNNWGGNSLYQGTAPTSNGRAYKVSYNRPLIIDASSGGLGDYSSPLHAEYPMIRWLEANGYDMSYFTDVDSDRNGSLIRNHKAFLSVGHDEYWSGPQRGNVEAARDAGVNLAFFSGNESFWKTRWENSTDVSGTPYRTLVCYKESWDNAQIDPQDSSPTWTWTGTWRDKRFSPPADGGRPENSMSGTAYMNDRTSVDLGISMTVPAADAKLRFWRNTAVANLTAGQVATLGQYTVGYETDEDLDNGFRPAGLIDMSSTTFNSPSHVQVPWGTVVGPGTSTHTITLYRASSRALVFAAGSVQWSWGLDGNHNDTSTTPDPSMEQATVNLFADMNLQPASLQSGLVAATASTDTVPPTSTITYPTSSTFVQVGVPITITGTASDAGGGVVAGVEVSVDGGVSWHPAVGRTSWSYTWTPAVSGPTVIKSRATDDSLNLETPSAGVSVTVSRSNFLSIWSGSTTPTNVDSGDPSAVEVGVKFRSDVAGPISGIRFYKSSANTGVHVGNLWSSTGTLLASATFTNETASGWQQVNFSTPVSIQANATYIASYHTNVGHYSEDDYYFTNSGVDNAPLHALKDGVDGGNGIYVYGSSSGFPNQPYLASNYWVDVVFNTSAGPTVTSETPAPGATLVATSTTVTATFDRSVVATTISFVLKDSSNNTVAATVSYNDTNHTATLTPNASLANSITYTATVSGAKDANGNGMAAPVTWSFTTIGAGSFTIWSSSATPTNADSGDMNAIEVGMKFRSDVAGQISGIRFYKSTLNTSAHVGNLWSGTGTLLASATFTIETASGWQQVNFSTPVSILANTTYVASYHTAVGHYADDPNYFANSGVDNAPLHALKNGVDGGNGIFVVGLLSAFPNQSSLASNYWVDVVLTTQQGGGALPPSPSGALPPSLSGDNSPQLSSDALGNSLSLESVTGPATPIQANGAWLGEDGGLVAGNSSTSESSAIDGGTNVRDAIFIQMSNANEATSIRWEALPDWFADPLDQLWVVRVSEKDKIGNGLGSVFSTPVADFPPLVKSFNKTAR
jgi:hypothetical protein